MESSGRRAAWLGFAFVALLLLQALLADIPTLDTPIARIQRFYAEHGGIIMLAQAISLVASVVFLLFAWGVAGRLAAESAAAGRRVRRAGALVAVSSVATTIPVLWLALLSAPKDSTVHALTRAADITDAVLFAAIALLAAEVARGTRLAWLQVFAVAVAALSLVRTVLGLLEVATLDVVAALAFLVLVVGISVACLRGRLRATAPA